MDFLTTEYEIARDTSTLSVVLEDSIMQKGKPATAGSKILSNFVSPFDATIITKLEEKGIQILGRTRMHEFGVAPMDTANAPTSGAILAVASHYSDVALCNDYFGIIKRQAAAEGLYYIQPTYGTVSRFGLIAATASMDQIGIVCRDLKTGFEVLSIIAGQDDKDGAMFPNKEYSYCPSTTELTLAIPQNILGENSLVTHFAENFSSIDLELPYFDSYGAVHYILSCAELSNNITRFDGIKFGYRTPNFRTLNELYLNSRTEGFSIDVKLAAIMGSMVLSKEQYDPYYDKAMRIRRLIQESITFANYNILALPLLGEDFLTRNAYAALPVFAGLPSITIPYEEGGIQLIGKAQAENTLFAAGEVATP